MDARGADPRIPARWALAAFVVTEIITRIVTTTLHLRGAGGNGGLIINGVHIHHMVFGLLILTLVALLWLVRQSIRNAGRIPTWEAIAFGVAWALILDESALILNLSDVYWTPLGDESLFLVAAFALVLAWLAFRPLPKDSR